MNDALLQLYHRLPPAARSVAASMRGLYLRGWRYGAETDRLVEEAHEREYWSPERWRAWREERLAYVLHRAATRVPYYREYWMAHRRKGGRASWELLKNWPILEKEPLRATPLAFVADDCDVRRMYHEHTSGSSGTWLSLWWSRSTVRAWYALFEQRWRRWYGVSRHDRWAILGGQSVVPLRQRTPPYWVWNAPLNQLYISCFHLVPESVPACLEALERYRIVYLLGYTSSLHALAQGALSSKSNGLRPLVAITNAEAVFDHQRAAIRKAFACPVRETYGMAEIVAAASECDSGSLHLWPEVGWIEAQERGEPVESGCVGDLICTGLFNADMPLVRYRVGDRGALSTPSESCECGRTLPIMASLEGRVDDVVYTADGRQLGCLDPVTDTDAQVREAQIIQEAIGVIRVRYVPAPGFLPEHRRAMAERLKALLGPVTVGLEEVDAIPRTSNGKFRGVISELSAEERKLLAARTTSSPIVGA